MSVFFIFISIALVFTINKYTVYVYVLQSVQYSNNNNYYNANMAVSTNLSTTVVLPYIMVEMRTEPLRTT
jgi:hypothetical protein